MNRNNWMQSYNEAKDRTQIEKAFHAAWRELAQCNDDKISLPLTELGEQAKNNLMKALSEFRNILVKDED